MVTLAQKLASIAVPGWAYTGIVLGYVALAYIAVIVFVVGVLFKVIRWAVTPKGPGGLYWGLYRLTLYPNVHSFWKAAGWILVRMFTFYTLLKENFGYVSAGFWFGLTLSTMQSGLHCYSMVIRLLTLLASTSMCQSK